MVTPPDPVLPAGYRLRPMEWPDLPAVHAIETQLFPQDAWPLHFFEEELSQSGAQSDGGTRDYRVVVAAGGASEQTDADVSGGGVASAGVSGGNVTGAEPRDAPTTSLCGQKGLVDSARKTHGGGGVVAESGEAGARGSAGVVGYCGLMCVPPLADVQTIAVVPEAEGRGFGTAMLQWMVAEAARRGALDVLLEVRQDNPRAQQFYVRHGFESIHTRAGYYLGGEGEPPVDALIMRRRLAPGN